MHDNSPWAVLLIGLGCLIPFTVQVSSFTRNRVRVEATVTSVSTSESDGVQTHIGGYR